MRWLAWFALLGLIAAACSEAQVYVYSARRYDPAGACLDPYKSIDQVNGTEVSSLCPPVCFSYGKDLYTSTVCPPLPDMAVQLDAQTPECIAASLLYDASCGAAVLDAGYDGG